MAHATPNDRYKWSCAKGLMPRHCEAGAGPQCALVPDVEDEHDYIAVVYDAGEAPPEITVKQVSGMVHTILANGIAVAVIAKATGKAPTPSDVLLVERSVGTRPHALQ